LHKIIIFSICILFVLTIIPVNSYADIEYDPLDGGWIKEIDGVKILHLNGSYYEMGYQHGYLLKEEAHENMRAILSYINEISSYDTMLKIWNKTNPYVPSCYIDEMQGISDGGQVPFETIAACYMTILFMDMQCFS